MGACDGLDGCVTSADLCCCLGLCKTCGGGGGDRAYEVSAAGLTGNKCAAVRALPSAGRPQHASPCACARRRANQRPIWTTESVVWQWPMTRGFAGGDGGRGAGDWPGTGAARAGACNEPPWPPAKRSLRRSAATCELSLSPVLLLPRLTCLPREPRVRGSGRACETQALVPGAARQKGFFQRRAQRGAMLLM